MRCPLFLLTMLLAVTVAAPASARPRNETPEKLYDQGLRQMKRGYYDEAIISFDKVRNHFPLNQYSVLAELRVADCLYERSDYISAVDAYQQFVRLHPRHEEVDYAHMRIGRSYFKQAHAIPQRDQTYTELTVKALEDYEERFPESDYLEDVAEMRGKCRGRLARAEAQIGDYYFWRGSYAAAERRYTYLVTTYPETDVAVRGRYRLGVCAYRMDRWDEATRLLEQFISTYPDARQVARAERWLDRIRAHPSGATAAHDTASAPAADDPGSAAE